MSKVAVASCAPRENNALDILSGDAGSQLARKIWIKPTLALLGVKLRWRRWRADIPGLGVDVEWLRNECRRRSTEIDMLDQFGDLRLCRLGELQLVEN